MAVCLQLVGTYGDAVMTHFVARILVQPYGTETQNRVLKISSYEQTASDNCEKGPLISPFTDWSKGYGYVRNKPGITQNYQINGDGYGMSYRMPCLVLAPFMAGCSL